MLLCRTLSHAALAALLIVSAAGQAAAQIGRVGGVVREEAGQPLKGATITAENSEIAQSFTATTDDKGRFIMIGLRAGRWRFFAQAPGFAAEMGIMAVRMGAPNPPITFLLKRSGVAAFGPLGGITGKDLQSALRDADAAFTQERWDDAVTAYRDVMARSAALSVINLQVGAAYRHKKDYTSALAAYNALLKVDPNNAKAHIGIAETEMERGDPKAAEEGLLRAAESAAAGREVFFSLAEVKFTRDEMSEAARWYQKASDADPFWGKPIYKLGLCAAKAGDADGAAKLMARVIAVDPVSPEAALAKASLESLKK
jgi:tetratricopeptide (TPR) repeat protein